MLKLHLSKAARVGLIHALTAATLIGFAASDPTLVQAADCDEIMPRVSYCSEIKQRRSGTAQAIYPDLVGGYSFKVDRHFVSSNIVAMPYDRQIASPDDAIRMMLRQLFDMGTSPSATLNQVEVDASSLSGQVAERIYFDGRTANGDPFGRYVVEVIQRPEALLLVYTSIDGLRAHEKLSVSEVEKVHEMSLNNLVFQDG